MSCDVQCPFRPARGGAGLSAECSSWKAVRRQQALHSTPNGFLEVCLMCNTPCQRPKTAQLERQMPGNCSCRSLLACLLLLPYLVHALIVGHSIAVPDVHHALSDGAQQGANHPLLALAAPDVGVADGEQDNWLNPHSNAGMPHKQVEGWHVGVAGSLLSDPSLLCNLCQSAGKAAGPAVQGWRQKVRSDGFNGAWWRCRSRSLNECQHWMGESPVLG